MPQKFKHVAIPVGKHGLYYINIEYCIVYDIVLMHTHTHSRNLEV